eukprot:TRINITY_DN9224_c0_g4_i1.p1 TRINITY_DN9224_c0_g4~~TRINITY_DN9224_c0_g4_i1.p1  ORF type:complete len:340 (+),score=31.93 TRINITY_DN9224_c0_g4_i1:590-1609(+)
MKESGRYAFYEWFPKRSTLTELKIFTIYDKFDVGECLKLHGKLQRFTFHECWLAEEAALSLLDSLSFNKDIHYLDLSESLCLPGYSAPIGRLINNLPLLTELNLRCHSPNQNFCDALKQNCSLTKLNLNGCEADDAVKVCEALHNHPALTWLDLGTPYDDNVSEGKISAITKLLQTKIPLQSLDLSGQYSNSCEIIELAEVLKSNHSLTFLSLESTLCGTEAAIAFAECLAVNTTLTELNLGENGIEDSGVIAIAQSLETNTSLKILDLHYNKIGDRGYDSLLQMLDMNTTLTKLRVLIYGTPTQEIEKKYDKRCEVKARSFQLKLFNFSCGQFSRFFS